MFVTWNPAFVRKCNRSAWAGNTLQVPRPKGIATGTSHGACGFSISLRFMGSAKGCSDHPGQACRAQSRRSALEAGNEPRIHMKSIVTAACDGIHLDAWGSRGA